MIRFPQNGSQLATQPLNQLVRITSKRMLEAGFHQGWSMMAIWEKSARVDEGSEWLIKIPSRKRLEARKFRMAQIRSTPCFCAVISISLGTTHTQNPCRRKIVNRSHSLLFVCLFVYSWNSWNTRWRSWVAWYTDSTTNWREWDPLKWWLDILSWFDFSQLCPVLMQRATGTEKRQSKMALVSEWWWGTAPWHWRAAPLSISSSHSHFPAGEHEWNEIEWNALWKWGGLSFWVCWRMISIPARGYWDLRMRLICKKIVSRERNKRLGETALGSCAIAGEGFRSYLIWWSRTLLPSNRKESQMWR